MKIQFGSFILLLILSLFFFQNGSACSGYKITRGNATMFGSNEDAWRVTPTIWFETGGATGRYGAAFTGSRQDGVNGYAPQAGMNEMGLAFERLSAYSPEKLVGDFKSKKTISNPTSYLKDILHTCKTVEDVYAFISKYNHSYFIEDVFIYVDRSGKYLVVEPYTLTYGNEPTYIFSNFCPSITPSQNANKLERYRNGVAFSKYNPDTTLAYCTALSDTMHVCRDKIGDGTLLSSIWDLSKGDVHLFFYHHYAHSVQFNLGEELLKGDHLIAIETLFPKNTEFEKLRAYIIPKNTNLLGLFVVACGGLYLFTAIYFLVLFFKNKQRNTYAIVQLFLIPWGFIMAYYMFVLSSSINVFYFPSPYYDPSSMCVSATSYIPFLLILWIAPFCIINYKLIQKRSWSVAAIGLFALNNLVSIILIGLFMYWGFYNVQLF